MYKNLAVAIIHGIGEQTEDFAKDFMAEIRKNFSKKLVHLVENPGAYLFLQPIQWASIFKEREESLFDKIVSEPKLDFQRLRKFIIHYVGDMIAYQPVETGKHNYERIHELIGKNLNQLSKMAGTESPLCVISHSLGSVIASNYFYDLQFTKRNVTTVVNPFSPLEKGDTLTLFYTLGTTLPLWSLRYHNFNRPINIPSNQLQNYHPDLKGEWINFYDKDDILGFPLKAVNENYQKAVSEDREVNVGGMLTSWNPLCHISYFKDLDIINSITDGLVRAWRQLNKL